MRNIRRAALAGATALAISLTGVTAHAADADNKEPSSVSKATDKVKDTLGSSKKEGEKKDEANTSSKIKDTVLSSKKDAKASEAPKADEKPETKNILGSSEVGSSNLGNKLGGDQAVNGRDVFGSSTEDGKDLPGWANILKYGTVASVITAILGLVVFPVYNFLKFNGFIR